MENIENKVALITGGSKGIGYGIAEAMLKQNMKVAITARSQESIDKAVEVLKDKGGEIWGVVAVMSLSKKLWQQYLKNGDS